MAWVGSRLKDAAGPSLRGHADAAGDTSGQLSRIVPAGLLSGGPLPLPFRRRPLLLRREAPAVRTPGGFGRPTGICSGSKALCHEAGELGQGDLAVAQLGALLGDGNGDNACGDTSSESGGQQQPLSICKHGRVSYAPREFGAAV
jgi:hypothetical protein